ncbi:MAG: hypothetical protein L6R40_004598 [Gallowayella cf. fulva]|nr:MAG: hypothetical protein L6R40_004598 [Xanthomendoza cf. fulva]
MERSPTKMFENDHPGAEGPPRKSRGKHGVQKAFHGLLHGSSGGKPSTSKANDNSENGPKKNTFKSLFARDSTKEDESKEAEAQYRLQLNLGPGTWEGILRDKDREWETTNPNAKGMMTGESVSKDTTGPHGGQQ